MTSFAESNHNYQWMFNLYQLVLCFPRREHLSEEDVVKNKVSNSQSFTTLLTFFITGKLRKCGDMCVFWCLS